MLEGCLKDRESFGVDQQCHPGRNLRHPEAMDVDEDLPGGLPPAISTAVVSEHSSCDESSLLESHQRGRRHKLRNAADVALDIPPSITEAACNSSEDEQSVGSVMTGRCGCGLRTAKQFTQFRMSKPATSTEGSTGTGGKLLYNENLDDEDEAYVYKHMRSGLEETVYLEKQIQEKNQAGATRGSSAKLKDESDMETASVSTNPQLEKALMLKPRTSDAVLSCPRCFSIVCMDCQQHESYANQFRAMFVMNIGVDWSKRIYYDEASGELRPCPSEARSDQGDRSAPQMEVDSQGDGGGPFQVPHDNVKEANSDEVNGREQYYSVHCGYCQHALAALDMKDEIYHFYGCIPSS